MSEGKKKVAKLEDKSEVKKEGKELKTEVKGSKKRWERSEIISVMFFKPYIVSVLTDYCETFRQCKKAAALLKKIKDAKDEEIYKFVDFYIESFYDFQQELMD